MKQSIVTMIFIFFLSTHNSFSQGITAPYEVGTWQGFRSAAISYTFDDNCPNQLAIAVPMFNEFDFKLTLFAVTTRSWAWPANWSGWQTAASQGHEIACHTVTHPHFTGLEYAMQVAEITNSKDTIESRITGDKCVTIAYPYCETGYDTLVARYFLAARICSGSIEPKTPGNFMRISSIVCGSQGSIKTSTDFKSKANSAASLNGWVVYLFHGINNNEPNSPYSPISADTLRKSLEYLNANPDKFWVTSFGNAAKYIRERNAASVSEIVAMEDSITITVSDTMDNLIYNCPITIRRPLPQDWPYAYVMQNGDTVASQIVEVASVKYLMFDVIPDNGNITLLKSLTTGFEFLNNPTIPTSVELHQNYPNPFNPTTVISYQLPVTSTISLKVYNLLGQELAVLFDGIRQPGNYEARFDGSKLPTGVYLYRLSAGSHVQTKKFILMK